MAADLFTPILNDRTRSVRFFNGRLLSGEAMTDEQSGLRAARELLAQAAGDGIVQGLEVKAAVGSSTILSPVLAVGAGVAINRLGEILLLANDQQVALVRPAHQAAAPASVFQQCTPPQQGVYVADSGVYLLTVCSIGAANGLAQVGGLGGSQASCNAKYIVDAVQFRLLELPVDQAILSDPRLRNLVAYQCFGVDHTLDFATDPFGTTGEPRTLIDDIRDTKQLTDCDVPLALIYWTATGGIQFLDMGSVRRRVTRMATSPSLALDDARLAVAEAMALQFQEQVDDLSRAGALSAATNATSFFRYLPPAGLLPLPLGALRGINYESFFSSTTWRGPAFLPDEKLEGLFTAALAYPPIDIESHELIWLYLGVANTRRANAIVLPRVQGFVAFVNGYVEYTANARFNLGRWNYANYSRI
jgi:hypothetical protein